MLRSESDGYDLATRRIGRAGVVDHDVAPVRRVTYTVADHAGADVEGDGARSGGVGMQNCRVSKAAARRAGGGDLHGGALKDVDHLARGVATPRNGDGLTIVKTGVGRDRCVEVDCRHLGDG